ncbi:hypothetical protein EON65_08530 [archaeon]|nr:MAG: hypothetical protein EON65_08530 [archaeon]
MTNTVSATKADRVCLFEMIKLLVLLLCTAGVWSYNSTRAAGNNLGRADILRSQNRAKLYEADVILHIGPSKTGTSHLQALLKRFSSLLLENGYCYPDHSKGGQKMFNDLPIHIMSNKPMNDIDKAVQDCFKQKKKLIFSCEVLAQLSQPEHFAKLREYFAGKKIYVLATYREPLSLSYSFYNQMRKSLNNIAETFSEYLQHGFAAFENRMKYRELQGYEAMLAGTVTGARKHGGKEGNVTVASMGIGRDSMTILDFYGAIAAHKDFAYVFICEVLGIICNENYPPDLGNNPSVNLLPYYLMHTVSQYVERKKCRIKGQLGVGMLKRYMQVNTTDLPVSIVDLTELREQARIVDQSVRNNYYDIMLYSNIEMNTRVRESMVLYDIDEAAMLKNDKWSNWLRSEAAELVRLGKVTCKGQSNKGRSESSSDDDKDDDSEGTDDDVDNDDDNDSEDDDST